MPTARCAMTKAGTEAEVRCVQHTVLSGGHVYSLATSAPPRLCVPLLVPLEGRVRLNPKQPGGMPF